MELIKYILDDGGRSIMAIITLSITFAGIRSCILAIRNKNDDEKLKSYRKLVKGTKVDKSTSHGIALKFTECFQKDYPSNAHAWELMDALRIDIDKLVQAKISELQKKESLNSNGTK